MNAAWGAGLLAASALLFAWAYGQYRRPSPSSWTESEILSNALMLVVIVLVALGVGFFGRFVIGFASEERWLTNMAVAAGSLVICWIFVPRLMAPAWRRMEASSASTLPEPANDPHPQTPSNLSGSAGKRSRRRAA